MDIKPEDLEFKIPPQHLTSIFLRFLRFGALAWGGPVAQIAMIRQELVEDEKWISDGLALSGLLPAPHIIFSTFIGYIGGSIPGAVIITIAIFAPAFAFTMIGHETFERLVSNHAVHTILDGVTAGAVGLIGATALGILNDTGIVIHAWVIFSVALIALFKSKSRWTVAWVVLAASLYGLVFL